MANDIVSSMPSSPHAVSNRGPALYESAALPVELCGHVIGFRGRSRARGRCDARGRAYMGPNAIGPFSIDGGNGVVGMAGVEPAAFSLLARCPTC